MKTYLIILFILVTTMAPVFCNAAFPVISETAVVQTHEIVEPNNVIQEDTDTDEPSGKGAGWTALAFATIGIAASILLLTTVNPDMPVIIFLAGLGGTIAGGTAMKWAEDNVKSIAGLSAGVALLAFGFISMFKYGLMGEAW